MGAEGPATGAVDDAAVAAGRVRAGCVEYIQFAVAAQRNVARLSARIVVEREKLRESGATINWEEVQALQDARDNLLNAGDKLHEVALKMLEQAKEAKRGEG